MYNGAGVTRTTWDNQICPNFQVYIQRATCYLHVGTLTMYTSVWIKESLEMFTMWPQFNCTVSI